MLNLLTKLSVLIKVIFILLVLFIANKNILSQENKWCQLVEKREEKPSVIQIFSDAKPKDAILVVYSTISTLEFKSNMYAKALEAPYKDKKYVVILTANEKQIITVSSTNYLPTYITIEKLKPLDPIFYSIECKEQKIAIGKGEFYLSSNPVGAVIEIDGFPDFNRDKKIVTPFTLKGYRTGNYEIKFTKQDYDTLIHSINIEKGKSGGQYIADLTPSYSEFILIVKPNNYNLVVNGKVVPVNNGKVRLNRFQYGKEATIEFKATHYYTIKKQYTLGFKKNYTIYDSLMPKMGSLTIISGKNADKGMVYINDAKIKELPLLNYPLQEKEYSIKVEKKGFGTFTNNNKSISIAENRNTLITANLESTKEIVINTEPDGADVYIDSVKMKGKTRLKTVLPIGKHKVVFERKHYKRYETTLEVTENLLYTQEFNYNLQLDDYPVTFISNPSGVIVYVHGTRIGSTPLSTRLSYGHHTVEYSGYNCLGKSKNINVTNPNGNVSKVRLFPTSSWNIGVGYSLNTYSLGIGLVADRIYLQGIINTTDGYSFDKTYIPDVSVNDIDLYNYPDGKETFKDSIQVGGNFKLGYLLNKPFPFIVTVGYVWSKSAAYRKIYKAQYDYKDAYGRKLLKGEYFSPKKYYKDEFSGISIGVVLPIARVLYLSVDYYSTSISGPGLYYGAGFMFMPSEFKARNN